MDNLIFANFNKSILLDQRGRRLDLIYNNGRRLGQWRVEASADDGFPWDENSRGRVTLNYALLRMNQTQIGLRSPVLLPDLEPLDGELRLGLFPVLAATAIGFSESPVSGQKLALGWLDQRQLELLSAEQSGYLTHVGPDSRSYLELESGEQLGRFLAYSLDGPPYAEDLPYDRLNPARGWARGPQQQGRALVRWASDTPDTFDRAGQACVRLSRADVEFLSQPTQVLVRPGHPLPGGDKISTIARVIGDTDSPQGEVGIDQTVRNAIGIEIGEIVILERAQIQRRERADTIFGRPGYVYCRIQTADLTTVEREVCLIDELTLELLGVKSGDDVVLEGIPGTDGMVPSVRMKAFKTSEEVQQRRVDLAGGDLTCRFPSSIDSLGVFPDLPWVFLDSFTRSALGLSGQKMGVVRLRASRTYQMGKELRELLLVLAVAFIGLISVVKNEAVLFALLITLMTSVLAVVLFRTRSRLSREIRRPRIGTSRTESSSPGPAPSNGSE